VTEKPVELLEILIGNSTRPGEIVIDPFAGSGSTGEAAFWQGCKFEGCDLDLSAVQDSRMRLGSLAA
jgi:site-specific DNA-methyltransferase (adenine-specific)